MANSNGWGDGASNNTIGWGQGANNAIGWGDSHLKSWAGSTDIAGFDSSAISYFNSTGITGATQQDAIDNLVRGLKDDGIWNKMKAIYPFATDNRNLASYTEDWANATWVKSNSTITSNAIIAPNGTLTADLFQANAAFGNTSLGGVRQTAGTFKTSIYVKGVTGVAAVGSIILGRGMGFTISTSGVVTVNNPIGYSSTNNYLSENVGNGWYRISFDWTYTTGVDGIVIASSNSGDSFYIWGVQCEQSSTISTYQPILTTQQAYISNQFKYNLKDPRDVDAAFRLVFNGGWTHSSTGATSNGTNGYADTKLNPLSVFSTNYASYGVYWRNTFSVAQTNIIGCCTVTNRFDLGYDNGVLVPFTTNGANNTNTGVDTDNRGLLVSTRQGLNTSKLFRNAILKVNTSSTFTANPNLNFYFAARNNSPIDYFANNQNIAFGHIGDGLTDTEASNLYTRVQAFQTALSRQV